MGQDFRAIMSHELTATDLPQLAERLNVITAGLKDQLAQMRLNNISDPSRNLPWHWGWSDLNEPDLESWNRGEPLRLVGVGSMTVSLGRHSLRFGCWVRWVEFVRDKHIQRLMRQTIFAFANFFQSNMAVYVPDSSSLGGEGALSRVDDGARIDEILGFLDQWRPAAVSIDSICVAVPTSIDGKMYRTVECEGYYVDKFNDLRDLDDE